MKSFIRIFLFELQYRSRRWDSYLYFIAFFVFCFYSITSSGVFVNYGGAGQRVFANSSITISFFISNMSIWLIAISAALMSVPIIRDKETKTFNYYYTLPITKPGYLLGRFCGSIVVLLIISLAVVLGIMAGYLMPGHDPMTLQPLKLIYFIRPYLLLIVFNLLITALIFFSMVVLTRNVLGGYMTAILIIALNMIATRLYDPQDMRWYILLDPYGEHAFYTMIRGWNILQRNTGLLPFESWLLYNRLLWLGVGLLLLGISYARFDFGRFMQERQSGRRTKDEGKGVLEKVVVPRVGRSFGFGDNLRHLFYQARLELSYHLKTVFFIVMVCAAGFILFYDALSVDNPTVGRMLEIKDGYFSIFALVILVFFAGEAVNRERELKLSHITDTLPVPNWVFTGSKLLSLIGISLLLCTLVLAAMLFTLFYKGVHDIRWDAYLTECYGIVFPYYALLAVLAFGIQVLVRNKFIGHSLMILFFILNVIAKSLGIEHNLLFYAAPPKPINGPLSGWAGYSIDYSEMNGYEPFMAGRLWFTLYWAVFALILVVLINTLWKRGIELNARERLRVMSARMVKPARYSLLIFGLAFVGCGGWIYYNTNILNEYLPQTSEVPFRRRAAYEKKYKRYEQCPLPWLSRLGVDAELYPGKRRAELTVHYHTENRSSQPIDTLVMTLPPGVVLGGVFMDEKELSGFISDKELQFYGYKLGRPILQGEKREIVAKVVVQFRGFLNETKQNVARFSSKYMALSEMDLPLLGYEPMMEIGSADKRKEFGLGVRGASVTGVAASGKSSGAAGSVLDAGGKVGSEAGAGSRGAAGKTGTEAGAGSKTGVAALEDSAVRSRNVWSRNSDWVGTDVTIGTDSDHVAVAPGVLQREWRKDGRRYFSYSSGSGKTPYKLAIYSGRFEVLKRYWNEGTDTVAIELYCYAGHTANADSLFHITKDYLAYLHRSGGRPAMPVIRYVEMPYQLSNIGEGTMQARFEQHGDGPNFMDYRASNVVLRDYFGQALAPAAAAGSLLYPAVDGYFSESGPGARYPFIKKQHTLFSATTNYLSGRASEKNQERTLRDSYFVPYMLSKADAALGSLELLLGEEKLKSSLLAFRESHAYKGPPYLMGSDLLDYLRGQVPDSLKARFDETFDKMVFYRNKVNKVVSRQEGNRYRIDIEVEKHKIEDDGLGNEKVLADEEYIDMGVFTVNAPADWQLPDVIQPVKLKEGVNRITLYTDKPPAKVIVDPHYALMNLLLLSGKNEQWKKV